VDILVGPEYAVLVVRGLRLWLIGIGIPILVVVGGVVVDLLIPPNASATTVVLLVGGQIVLALTVLVVALVRQLRLGYRMKRDLVASGLSPKQAPNIMGPGPYKLWAAREDITYAQVAAAGREFAPTLTDNG
jgi:hypothetical protein